jgi:hypothetical protein
MKKALVILMFLLILTEGIFSQEKDAIKRELDVIYNYLDGMKVGLTFARFESYIAHSTSIFEIQEVRETYDTTEAVIKKISSAAAGISGLIGVAAQLLKYTTTDSNTLAILDNTSTVSLSAFSIGFSLSSIMDLFDSASKQKLVKIASQIAIARKAYDDFGNRKLIYEEQAKNIDLILAAIETIEKINVTDFGQEENLRSISNIANRLSELSILLFLSIDEMKNSIASYIQITRDINGYVKGDTNALASIYEGVLDQLNTFDNTYREKLKKKLLSLKDLITAISLKDIKSR